MAKSSKSGVPWAEIGSAAFAATIGGVLGMLFAPQSGKKTRQALASEGKKLAKSSVRTVKRVKKEVDEAVVKQVKATAKLNTKTVVAKPVKKVVRRLAKTVSKTK